MRFTGDRIDAFTTRADGRARELKNDVWITEAFDPRQGLPQPTRKKFVAIWDTGATNTVITRSVVEALSLQPSGKATACTVGSGSKFNEYEADTYLINLALPNDVMIMGLSALESGIGGADVLIGMDVISHGDFAVTTFNSLTCWTFRIPSVKEIDFVKEIDEQNQKYKHLLLSPDDKRKLRNQAKRDRRSRR